MTGPHAAAEPPVDCALCPRLQAFRRANAAAAPDWFNGAVPSFGDLETGRLLIVGLAPGLRGANRTGRPFTGDQSGVLLFSTLLKFDLAQGRDEGHANDGLQLIDTVVTNAVRCVPPGNKPSAVEIKTCRRFLSQLLRRLERLKIIVALGRVAHDTTLSALERRKASHAFSHGARHALGEGLMLFDSYHCSRYNINTGRLTEAMFHDVFRRVRAELNATGEC